MLTPSRGSIIVLRSTAPSILPWGKRVLVEGEAEIQIVIQTFKSKKTARKMYPLVTKPKGLYNSWMELPRNNRLGVWSGHRPRLFLSGVSLIIL